MAMEGTVQSIEVSAAPQFVFEVALHLEAYPEWVTGVKSVDILEEDDFGRPVRVAFVADAMIKEISYDLDYEYDPPVRMSWTAVPGDDIRERISQDSPAGFPKVVGSGPVQAAIG